MLRSILYLLSSIFYPRSSILYPLLATTQTDHMLNQQKQIDPIVELTPAANEPTQTGIVRVRHSPRAPMMVFILLCGIWGSTWIFIKMGLRDLPPISFAGIRFVIAVFLLAPLIIARRPQLPRTWSDWKLLMLTGVLAFTLNYGLLFWGEQHTSSGLAALLQATIPLFGMLFAHYYLPSERVTLRKLAGSLIGLAGVGLIFANQMSVEWPLGFEGSLSIVFGALCVAYSNVLVKARARHFDPSILAAGQMFFGLIPLLAIGFAREGSPLTFHWTPLALFSLLYLALVGSSLAFFLYYWLVRHMDVTKTMLIALVTPLIAVVIGMVAAGESLSWRIALGGVGILAGIRIINATPSVSRRKPRIAGDETAYARERS
jgi:drug/metabolite transporter (DMT)-like permease